MATMTKKVGANVPIWVFLVTFVILVFHPIPECVACEYPNPWGRDDGIYARDSIIFTSWLFVASFTAGAFQIKRSWLVPLAIVVADLVTQPFGGVTISSLMRNEGPMILFLGLLFGALCLGVGWLTRIGIDTVRRKG